MRTGRGTRPVWMVLSGALHRRKASLLIGCGSQARYERPDNTAEASAGRGTERSDLGDAAR
eukprot:3942019-Prymnesium_polylepis.1